MKNGTPPPYQTTTTIPDQRKLQKSSKYTVKGTTFEVERIFKDDGKETISTILLRLLQMESQT